MRTALACLAILTGLAAATAGEAFSRPEVIRFGATSAEIQGALLTGRACTTMKVRPIVPPFLRDIKVAQEQIDCDGFMFMGRARWAEFVIGDDALKMVWIMTTAEERQSLEAAMIRAYGPPTRRGKRYVAFETARAALRVDKHEVLFYGEALDRQASAWFGAD